MGERRELGHLSQVSGDRWRSGEVGSGAFSLMSGVWGLRGHRLEETPGTQAEDRAAGVQGADPEPWRDLGHPWRWEPSGQSPRRAAGGARPGPFLPLRGGWRLLCGALPGGGRPRGPPVCSAPSPAALAALLASAPQLACLERPRRLPPESPPGPGGGSGMSSFSGPRTRRDGAGAAGQAPGLCQEVRPVATVPLPPASRAPGPRTALDTWGWPCLCHPLLGLACARCRLEGW